VIWKWIYTVFEMNIKKHPQGKGMNQVLIETPLKKKKKLPISIDHAGSPVHKYEYDIDNC